jgi:pyridoxal phosphate enzyme (YggS family)
LQAVRDRIREAARVAGRDPHAVTLLAVSKSWPVSAVRDARDAGQRAFGENYAQEGAEKARLASAQGMEWHFIGPVQSNKTALIAANFDWVHGIDRLKVAQRLAVARAGKVPGSAPLNLCLQVNVSGEASKAGVAPGDVRALAVAVAGLPHVRLRGLMAIPEPAREYAAQRRPFRILRELLEQLAGEEGLALDTLSMGMSADLEAAIAEGATIVRVGTAIFGERSKGNA